MLKKTYLFLRLTQKKKIILISIKKFKNIRCRKSWSRTLWTNKSWKNSEYFLNSDSITSKHKNFLGHFLHGLKLKSYEFKKYKTKKELRIINLNILGNTNKPSAQNQLRFKALEEGTFYARDLVSEPGNVLHPDEYAKRLNSLKKDGLKVKVFNKRKLKKLGMNALLGVGMGSIRGSYLVTMEWNGAEK